jgi:DNA-binding MarR family transcriptional regulator
VARYKNAVTSGEYRALAEFRYEIRRFLHFSEQAARAARIEPQQYQLLIALKGMPADAEPTVKELAERLQIQHHSAVELLDRSATRGLVRRTRAAGDRRQVLVHLLPKGERLLRELALHHRDALTQAAPALVRALEMLLAAGREQPRVAAKKPR